MIVLGADAHKRSHTIAAVSATTGELHAEQTVQVGVKGFAALLAWARSLDGQRVWALEDCRHVSGSFERFLIGRGERVLRVTTKLMADSRRVARGRGKSDSIDATAVARAALREGLDTLPAAHLDGPELDLRLLVDHRERLVRQRVALNNTLQWHLHRSPGAKGTATLPASRPARRKCPSSRVGRSGCSAGTSRWCAGHRWRWRARKRASTPPKPGRCPPCGGRRSAPPGRLSAGSCEGTYELVELLGARAHRSGRPTWSCARVAPREWI
jgi:hypothetical protein